MFCSKSNNHPPPPEHACITIIIALATHLHLVIYYCQLGD